MADDVYHPVAHILDHGIIRSTGDFTRLGIVDWMRYKQHWESPHQAMEIVASHFVKRMSFFVARLNLYAYPERDDFPVNIQWHTFETSIFLERDGENLYLGEIADIAKMPQPQAHLLVQSIIEE